MGVTIYGIKACDTMQKARAWLARTTASIMPSTSYKASGVEARPAGGLGEGGGLGGAAQPRRHDLPQAARRRQGRPHRGQGHRPDVGPALDDQATGALETGAGLIVGFKPEIYAARLG